jgi:hypothetical protein
MFLWFLWGELLQVVVTDCKSAASGLQIREIGKFLNDVKKSKSK